jgi:hypothetical protein
VLCRPITRKRRNAEASDGDEGDDTYTALVYRPRWFVLSQTESEELPPLPIPGYDSERTLAEVGIERVVSDLADGNCQGFARRRQITLSPVAQLPHKTLFHEAAPVVLGHTSEGDFTDMVTHPETCARSRLRPSRCCAASRSASRAPSTAVATSSTGLKTKEYPSRAHRGFCTPPTRSCAPGVNPRTKIEPDGDIPLLAVNTAWVCTHTVEEEGLHVDRRTARRRNAGSVDGGRPPAFRGGPRWRNAFARAGEMIRGGTLMHWTGGSLLVLSEHLVTPRYRALP